MAEFSGPAFSNIDPREVGLRLVRNEYTNAVLFQGGRLVQPSDVLRKRPIIVVRRVLPHRRSRQDGI